MRLIRGFAFLFALLLPAVLSAQNEKADGAAKEKLTRRQMLIEQILTDAPNLKLGENRALVYAKVGAYIWEADQKRARGLFQTAISELIDAQAYVAANQRGQNNNNELLTGGQSRPQLLNLIASRDAALALDNLVKTRPAAIVKALAAIGTREKNTKISDSYNTGYLAQNEINFEQNLIKMAASQDPERAAKLLKDALGKGLTNESLNLLNKLAEIDKETAATLAAQVVDQMMQAKYKIDDQPNYPVLQSAINFLTQFIAQKTPSENALVLDTGQMQHLADRLFAFYLDDASMDAYNAYSVVPIAEKLSPALVDRLKARARNGSRRGDFSGYDPELQKLLYGESTAEQILAAAKDYPAASRRQIYQSAANKFAQQGNMDRAMDILDDNFSDDALAEANRNLKYQYSSGLISSGKFAEAERVIDEMDEAGRGNQLISLANAIYQKDHVENLTYAVAVVEKARALIPEKPENATDMSSLMQVIGAYAQIKPAEAFRMYEQTIPQINELSDAAAVLNGFQGSWNVRNGEFLMSQGMSSGINGPDFYVLSTFCRNDFDRAIKLIDMFTRRETRISLRLQLLNDGLN